MQWSKCESTTIRKNGHRRGRQGNKRLNSTEFDPDRVQQVLEAQLQGVEKPPPMTEVTRRVGHDKRIIYKHFPNLCRAISAQYVKYKFKARENRIRQCCEQVRRAVQKLYGGASH